jgi:hypothetical protein
MIDFDYFRCRTWFSHAIELVASCLPFQNHKFSLNQSSINPDIVKNPRRGQTLTVKKRDSNSWTVTVQVYVNERV